MQTFGSGTHSVPFGHGLLAQGLPVSTGVGSDPVELLEPRGSFVAVEELDTVGSVLVPVLELAVDEDDEGDVVSILPDELSAVDVSMFAVDEA